MNRAMLRSLFVLVGLVTIAWSTISLYFGLTETPLKSIAAGIAAGQTYDGAVLESLAPLQSDGNCRGICNSEIARSLAVIRVRQAEVVLKQERSELGKAIGVQAEKSIRLAVSLSPSDSFLWFALAWIAKNNRGYDDDVSRYLQLSYATGAYEGWIAVHRNGFVVGLLPAMPSGLRYSAFSEFRGLVESSYIDDAASIVTGPGWAQHDALLSAISGSPIEVRSRLAGRLVEIGFDLHVPGVDRAPSRPWH